MAKLLNIFETWVCILCGRQQPVVLYVAPFETQPEGMLTPIAAIASGWRHVGAGVFFCPSCGAEKQPRSVGARGRKPALVEDR